ncbi:MAG: DUF2271 domain-containing protein [Verrucomicrobiales bacterium]|nr:DUF2271 domain-containing protein [Verrucomicrobiales bacterium]
MKSYLLPISLCTLLIATASSRTASSGELQATIEIPQLDVAEYHRPYLAVWIETPDRKIATHIAVWYDTEMKDKEGETWLKDLRQWWRKGGRSLTLPLDTVSGPTRPVGEHQITVSLDSDKLKNLAPGPYIFVVEASREVGGREMLRLPFEWSDKPNVEASAEGETELGKISLTIKS